MHKTIFLQAWPQALPLAGSGSSSDSSSGLGGAGTSLKMVDRDTILATQQAQLATELIMVFSSSGARREPSSLTSGKPDATRQGSASGQWAIIRPIAVLAPPLALERSLSSKLSTTRSRPPAESLNLEQPDVSVGKSFFAKAPPDASSLGTSSPSSRMRLSQNSSPKSSPKPDGAAIQKDKVRNRHSVDKENKQVNY